MNLNLSSKILFHKNCLCKHFYELLFVIYYTHTHTHEKSKKKVKLNCRLSVMINTIYDLQIHYIVKCITTHKKKE